MTPLPSRASVAIAHPGWTLALGIVVTAASLAAAARWLEFQPGRDRLIGADQDYHRAFLRLREEFGNRDWLVVVLRGPPAARDACAGALRAKLRARSTLFGRSFYRIDPSALGGRLLWLAPPAALDGLERALREHRPLLEACAEGDPARALEALADALARRAQEPLAEAPPEGSAALAGLADVLSGAAEAARGVDVPPPLPADPLAAAVAERPRDPECGWLLVEPLARPGDLAATGAAVAELRRLLAELAPRFPKLSLGLTGKPALTVDEMATYRSDAQRATLLSLGGVILLYALAFGRLQAPLLAAGALVAALAWTFGFAALALGRLNLLSIVFAVVLVGLGIDSGIHLIARCEEERDKEGADWPGAVERSLRGTRRAVWTAAITTGLAFLSAWFTDFQGMRELGLIAGVGVLLCALAATTLLPAALVLLGPSSLGRARPRSLASPPGAAPPRPRPRAFLLVSLVALGLAGGLAGRGLRFEFDLLSLQAEGTPSVEWERRLLRQEGSPALSVQVLAEDLDDARRVAARLRALPCVAEVYSPADLVPADPRQRGERLAALRALLPPPAPSAAPRSPASLVLALGRLRDALEELEELALAGGRDRDADALDACVEACDQALLAAQDPKGSAALARYAVRCVARLRGWIEALHRETSSPPPTLENLAPELRRLFVGKSGKLLVSARPRGVGWDEDSLRGLRDAIRGAVGLRAAGFPIQVYETLTRLRDGYLRAGAYALAAVFVVLLVDLRSLRSAGLALGPTLLGAGWLLGAMRLLGLDFNAANLMALPVVFGAGVDAAVHVLHRMGASEAVADVPPATRKAVVVSGLTTAIGFGALASAQHRGLASLGTVMALGILAALLAALVTLPPLVGWLGGGRLAKGRSDP
ncbi:MAG: hypothetical protein D6731_06830 [Planctomycetota bacterium]|nr:MAG: hypothetical protein D6731_06830 [Planctomycetota bacterium]